MKILSEIDLIKKISRHARLRDPHIIRGIGDDAAVIDRERFFELVSVDSFVDGDHFRLDWFTPEQIGMKAVEATVSDIAAMGGIAKYFFLSLTLCRDTSQEFVERLYQGVNRVLRKYTISLLGGDTVHGKELSVTATILGEVPRAFLRLRSGARRGDVLCVTGKLGAACGGLHLLRKFGSVSAFHDFQTKGGIRSRVSDRFFQRYFEPKSRLAIAPSIAKYASAMIDVSDGLASEVRHICEESGVGACVYAEKIPLDAVTRKAADICRENALNYALSGGEDFELVFTISRKNLVKLRQCFRGKFYEVGEIVSKEKDIFLLFNGEKRILPGGYDHFGGTRHEIASSLGRLWFPRFSQ